MNTTIDKTRPEPSTSPAVADIGAMFGATLLTIGENSAFIGR